MAPAPRGAVGLLLLAAVLICAPLLLQLKLGLNLSHPSSSSELRAAQFLISGINLQLLRTDQSVKQLEERRKHKLEEQSSEESTFSIDPNAEAALEPASSLQHDAAPLPVAPSSAPLIDGSTKLPVAVGSAPTLGPHCTIDLHVDTKAVGDTQWLRQVFEGLDGRVGTKEIEKIRAVGAKHGSMVEGSCGEDTYGEITAEGLQTLLQHESMQPSRGVFFDLGAGTGHAVVNVALHHAFSEVIGIELSEQRYNQGCEAFQRLSSGLSDSSKPGVKVAGEGDKEAVHVVMALGDATTTSLSNVDVVYVASVCFRPSLLEVLVAHLCKELRPGVRVASARPLREDFSLEGQKHDCGGGKSIKKTATFMVGMTWGSSFVHIYQIELQTPLDSKKSKSLKKK